MLRRRVVDVHVSGEESLQVLTSLQESLRFLIIREICAQKLGHLKVAGRVQVQTAHLIAVSSPLGETAAIASVSQGQITSRFGFGNKCHALLHRQH